MRREAFFFSSRGVELFGSLYVATEPTHPVGIVACNSWGVEADRCDHVLRKACIELAQRGGAGLFFNYPGYGDSYGDLATVDMSDLSAAAVDAVEQATRRCQDVGWVLAGCMLGAAVASLAQADAGTEAVLLVQPSLRPGEYFRRLAERSETLAPGLLAPKATEAGGPKLAYGYPLPRRILDNADAADAEVVAALERFTGEGAVIHYEASDLEDVAPSRFRRISVPGTWRFGSYGHPKLTRASVEWLEQRLPEGVR